MVSSSFKPSLSSLMEDLQECAVIAIDMPMGLPECIKGFRTWP